jgi:hypothetical protein
MKIPEYSPCVLLFAVAIGLIVVFGKFSMSLLLVSLGTAAVVYSIKSSLMVATIAGIVALFGMAAMIKYREGYNTNTPTKIVSRIRGMKEGFNTNTPATGIVSQIQQMMNKKEGFLSEVAQNISRIGAPGFGMGGPLVEGFEDSKDTKRDVVKESKPALVAKDEMAQPFKLGEIPSQVKNGPHIDAGSTLIKAIQGLNPDQINAMTKDTQQLIETQKSLMGMLGTMKPMMNDGKELMETFQQMFGQQ